MNVSSGPPSKFHDGRDNLWDLEGAVKLLYEDPSAAAYPAEPPTKMTFDCAADGITPVYGNDPPRGKVPYGRAFFVGVAQVRAQRIRSRRGCRAATQTFMPGPFELRPPQDGERYP